MDPAMLVHDSSSWVAMHPGRPHVMRAASYSVDPAVIRRQQRVHVGDSPDKGTYTLDSTTDPKGMPVTGTDGPNKGKTFPAIYELHGDTLRICYDLSGQKRPTEFKSTAGTKLYLVTYARAKE